MAIFLLHCCEVPGMMHSHHLIMAIITLLLIINEHNEFYIADIKSFACLVIPVYQQVLHFAAE